MSQTNSADIHIRVTPELKVAIHRAAHENYKKIADYIRDLITVDLAQNGDGSKPVTASIHATLGAVTTQE